MAGLTRNLRLRLADDLTADARYNLERIDQLGSVFPISSSANQTINSAADIRLNANSTTLGGDGDGTVFAPNLQLSNALKLESGAYTFTLRASVQTQDLNFTLPPDFGTSGQFLTTSGAGGLTWTDPPTSNFSSLNDTTFTNLTAGQLAQYDGSAWVNVTLPSSRQSGVFNWLAVEGATKTITHGWGTTNIQVWIYEPGSSSIVYIESLDYLDSDTIVLSAHSGPDSDYIVHLIQTI